MQSKDFLNLQVSHLTGVAETKGDVFGIELELEGRKVGLADIPTKGWRRTHDGSLRGEAIEYTTLGSKDLKGSKEIVNSLFKKFAENEVKFNDSIRTSTHVHLNFADKPIKHAINFFALFTLFEEVLQHYSGEDRKGNLFCISSREAEDLIYTLSASVRLSNFGNFARDKYKYSACNLSTLYKFGTVEVRTMRGASSAEQVNNWLDILNDMYQYAQHRMTSPVDLITDLSAWGAAPFMARIFSFKNVAELNKALPKDFNLHFSLLEGARMLQMFAYEFQEDFKDVGRDKRNILPRYFVDKNGLQKAHSIYKPDGNTWVTGPLGGGAFFYDGTALTDDTRIKWSSALQRFIAVRRDTGEVVECRWFEHPVLGNEGPPAMPVALRHFIDFRNNAGGIDLGLPDLDLHDDDEEEDDPDWGDDEPEDWDA
jgi:hypothetical protein